MLDEQDLLQRKAKTGVLLRHFDCLKNVVIRKFAVRSEVLMPVCIPMRKGDEEHNVICAGDEGPRFGIEIAERFTHLTRSPELARDHEKSYRRPDQDRGCQCNTYSK